MPRKPDPGLESIILDSALRLLDTVGLDLLTMRDVARGAHTSTPTIYERFTNREALVWSLVAKLQADVHRRVLNSSSIEDLVATIEQYLCDYPNRLDLFQRYWPMIMDTGRPRPVFELAKSLLMQTHGFRPAVAEQVAMALAALLIGTAVLRRGAGDGPVADLLVSSCRTAMHTICQLSPGENANGIV